MQSTFPIVSFAEFEQLSVLHLVDHIRTVLSSVTAPTSQFIGDEVFAYTPARIREQFGAIGVIEKDAFFAYYGDVVSAVAIVIATVKRLPEPRGRGLRR